MGAVSGGGMAGHGLTGAPVEPPAVLTFELARQRKTRRQAIQAATALALFALVFVWALEVTGFLSTGAGQGAFQSIGDFLARMNPGLELDKLFEDRSVEGSISHWYNRWPQWRDAMVETVEMAFVSTVLGSVLGLIAALLSARTTMPFLAVRWVTKRILELIRTMPDLILAIILVALFGLGPFAGVLTLVISAVGSLGRYFSDALENIDQAQREAVRAAGGGYVQQIRYGVLPQVAPVILSFSFLRLEVNVSAAATLGLVGAGGIGVELLRALTFNQYQSYLAILLLILAVIVTIDLTSEQVRHRMARTGAAL